MPNYYEIIKIKYPQARGPMEEAQNFELSAVVDVHGQQTVYLSAWNILEEPAPTLAELDAFAQTNEFLIPWGVNLKAAAEAQVNDWANMIVMAMKILEPELFYVAMVTNVAFRLLEWNSLGKPTELDPARFMVTLAEAQAFAETSQPAMTATQLLSLQETKWLQMQQGFAVIVYKRRLALEKIKLAPVGEGLEAELAAILAGLGTEETINTG